MEKLINLSVSPFPILSVGQIIVPTPHRVVMRIKLVNVCKGCRKVLWNECLCPPKVHMLKFEHMVGPVLGISACLCLFRLL